MPIGNDYDTDNPNLAVSRTVISAFLYTTDHNEGALMAWRHGTTLPRGGTASDRRGVTNYKAVARSNWAWGDSICRHSEPTGRWANESNGIDRGNGIICRNFDNRPENVTRFRNVSDGTSNTFEIGEAVPAWCSHTWWYWSSGTTATTGIPLNYKSATIVSDPNRTLETQRLDWGNNYSFMNRHPGGANFAMVDGSVRFVSDTIDLMTYRRLGSMSDGRPVQLPWAIKHSGSSVSRCKPREKRRSPAKSAHHFAPARQLRFADADNPIASIAAI